MPSWPMEEIQALLEPIVTHLGYSVYKVDQVGPGGRTLRLAIDRTQGSISIEDCTRVAEVVSPVLDQADLISGSYTLEVSSPGAERPLRDRGEYERFLGRKVNVRYHTGDAEGVLEG